MQLKDIWIELASNYLADSDRIDEFKERFEKQARDNMEKELKKL